MILLEFFQNLFRCFVRIDSLCSFDKRALIFAQLRVADLQKSRQRHINHLVVQKFQSIILRADSKRTFERGSNPFAASQIIAQSANRAVVAAFEFASNALSFTSLKLWEPSS